MKKIQMKKQNEDAVSPVIGVMLMLVVTIIIAALVAVFSSGVVGSTDPAPNALLKASVDSAERTVYLTSISGDKIDLSKVTVAVYNDDGEELAEYHSPTKANGVGDMLESGNTLDIKKGAGGSPSINAEPGDLVSVIVTYGTYVLFEEEVRVV